jgi:hypothetical protein
MPWAPTFGGVETGGYLIFEDSYGRLCIAQNQGNAAQTLNVDEGATITVRRAPEHLSAGADGHGQPAQIETQAAE